MVYPSFLSCLLAANDMPMSQLPLGISAAYSAANTSRPDAGPLLIFCCLLGSELDGRLAKARRHFLLPTRQRTGGRRPTSTLPISKLPTGSEQPTASSQSATDFLSCLLGSEPTCVAAAATTTFLSCLLGSERAHKEHSRPELFCCLLGSELTLAEKLSGVNFCCLLGSELELARAAVFHLSKLPTRQRTVPKSTQPFDSKEKQRPTH